MAASTTGAVVVVGVLRVAAEACGARLVFLSTDYVFDGQAGPSSAHDVPNPLSTYGPHKQSPQHI